MLVIEKKPSIIAIVLLCVMDLVVDEAGEILYLVVEPTKLLKRYVAFGAETNINAIMCNEGVD